MPWELEEPPSPPRPHSELGEESEENETELAYCLATLTEINDDLHKISFKIQELPLRVNSLRTSKNTHNEFNQDTSGSVDSSESDLSRLQVRDMILGWRSNRQARSRLLDSRNQDLFLVDRIGSTVSERRERLILWYRSYSKSLPEQVEKHEDSRCSLTVHTDPLSRLPRLSEQSWSATEPEQMLMTSAKEESISDLSELELPDYSDSDSTGLPPPRLVHVSDREIICGYCWTVCSSQELEQPRWRQVPCGRPYCGISNADLAGQREHILRDLRPYVCTYRDCPDSEMMYGTRRSWLKHERLVHRKVWQCFEHDTAAFSSEEQLKTHLENEHENLLTATQISSILEMSQCSTKDDRTICPFCLVSDDDFPKKLSQHIAVHLEQISALSVPESAKEEDYPKYGRRGLPVSLSNHDVGPSSFGRSNLPNSSSRGRLALYSKANVGEMRPIQSSGSDQLEKLANDEVHPDLQEHVSTRMPHHTAQSLLSEDHMASSTTHSRAQSSFSTQVGAQFENALARPAFAQPLLSESYMADDRLLRDLVSNLLINAGDTKNMEESLHDVDETLTINVDQTQSTQLSASRQRESLQDAEIYAALGLLAPRTPYQTVSSQFGQGSSHLPYHDVPPNELLSTPLAQQPSFTFSTPLDVQSNLNLTIPLSPRRGTETDSETSISPSTTRIRKRRIPGGYRCTECQAVYDRRTDLR